MVIDGIGVLVDLYVSSYIAVPRSCFLSRLPDAIFGSIRLRRLAFGLAGGFLAREVLVALLATAGVRGGAPKRVLMVIMTARVVCIGEEECL